MAREIDFSPLARYTARQQQNEDMAAHLLAGSLANAGKTFEPLLRQGFSQKMIADAGERPWEVLGKLAAYNPEMHKSFAPEAKQAHLAHISKETDFSAKLRDLEEKQRRLDALNEEKRKWHEKQNPEKRVDDTIEETKDTPLKENYTQTLKPFDPVADARFMYPVTADKGGLLRQTGKSPIENEIAIAEAELNIARKGLQPVLKIDEIPTLDSEKVLKAKQQALVNEGYLEEAKRLESNLLSDEQRFMNALGKIVNDASARILALEQELHSPETTETRKNEIKADLRTLRAYIDYIRQGKKPYTVPLEPWILAGRSNSNLDFSKDPYSQTNGGGNVEPSVNDEGGNDGNAQNIYSGSNTLQGVKNTFERNLKAASEFKNNDEKDQWVDKQIGLVKDNPHLTQTEKEKFDEWAREKMKTVGTEESKNVAANATKLETAKQQPGFKAFENYDKLAGAFERSKPEKVEEIPDALMNLKANITNDTDGPIINILSKTSKKYIGYDLTEIFKSEEKPTIEQWNKFVNESFGLSNFERWFGEHQHLMTTKERNNYQTKINGVKNLMMGTGKKKPAQSEKTSAQSGEKSTTTPPNENLQTIQRRGSQQ